ncbi:MAG: HEPN domain-containing protein [Candidatus Nitrosocaldus sp.]|nr:HEPN domain-containing protein [Candidatus Nitrosocaldus sp.]MDW8000370.1 HEPN domain-containing protein [Candidatus Nitrosocaldus sp.]
MVVRRDALLWLESARDDVEDAKRMFDAGRYFRAAFLAQQAAEKALKALFFTVRREEPPRLHTVTELYAMLKEHGFTLPKGLEEQLSMLNKYYTITRYPDAANGLPRESVDRIEAERAMSIAMGVLEHAGRGIEG